MRWILLMATGLAAAAVPATDAAMAPAAAAPAAAAPAASSGDTAPVSIRTPSPSIIAVNAPTMPPASVAVNEPSAIPSRTMARNCSSQRLNATAVAFFASGNVGDDAQN